MSKKKEIVIESEEAKKQRFENEEAVELKKKLFFLENETERKSAMKMLDEKYTVICIGGKTTVYNKDRDDNKMMSVRDARDYFANKTYTVKRVGGKNDIIEERQVFDDWFAAPETKRYESLTFDPEAPFGDCKNEWNTWRGWKYTPAAGDCSLYLEHIKENICDGDADINEYILDFLAQMIQNPKKKIFHSLAIKGQKGTGRSVFVQIFMELFGDAAVEISDSDVLTNQFNGILANRILIYGDEAFWSGDRKNRGKLKNLISSPVMRITYKSKDTITMPNYLRFIFTTNEDWAAPVEKGERRWVTLRCGNGKIRNSAYFKEMLKQMEQGGYAALMKLFIERDISKRDWSNVPMTEASKEDMAFTTIGDNAVAEYLDQCVGGMEFSIFNSYSAKSVPSAKFTEAVQIYASKAKSYPSITPMYIACKLKDIFGADFKSEQKKIGEQNTRIFNFGSMETVEATINAYYNRN
jgi:hypothetical protein